MVFLRLGGFQQGSLVDIRHPSDESNAWSPLGPPCASTPCGAKTSRRAAFEEKLLEPLGAAQTVLMVRGHFQFQMLLV